jgi:hypothetical protein
MGSGIRAREVASLAVSNSGKNLTTNYYLFLLLDSRVSPVVLTSRTASYVTFSRGAGVIGHFVPARE